MTSISLNFTVPGEPKGKGRPRVTRSGHAFTPKDTVMYENLVRTSFTQKYPEHIPVPDREIRATIKAFYGMPKASKKKTEDMVTGKIRPKKKPDLDNIAKSILDSLNGIAFRDDSLVVDLSVSKHYADQPRVVVWLEYEDLEE